MNVRNISGRMMRPAALLLALIIIFAAFPLCSFSSSAEQIVNGKVKVYHWKRVCRQWDIHDGKFMLMWNNGIYIQSGSVYYHEPLNDYCFTGGNGANVRYTSNYPYVDGGSYEFYTLFDYNAFTLVTSGYDGDNGDMRKGRIYRPDGKLLHCDDEDMKWSSKRTDSHDQWTICTGEVDCDYGDETAYDYVQIIHNQSGGDVTFVRHSTCFSFDTCGSTWDVDDFIMYIATEEEYSALGDYTVPAGTTLQLNDDVILTSGSTLTIEPGAVLSVKGRFYNNGTIINQGTIVLEKDSIVSSLDPTYFAAGTIRCIGGATEVVCSSNGETARCEGNLVILNEAKLCIPSEDAILDFGQGSSCQNNGMIAFSGNALIDNAKIVNSDTSVVLIGYKLTNSYTLLKTYNNFYYGMLPKTMGLYPIYNSKLFMNDSKVFLRKGKYYLDNTEYVGASGLTYITSDY